MSYKPIESYGLIGDMHTAALVGTDGSIDWCCLPRFDSPSVFARLVDDRRGGYFKISPTLPGRRQQMYMPDTAVLITRFLSTEGVGELVDFMPVKRSDSDVKSHQIVRIAKAVRGSISFRLDCLPAFDFARKGHEITQEGRGAVFHGGDFSIALTSRFPLATVDDGVCVEFTLHEGEEATFLLRQVEGAGGAGDLLEARLTGQDLLHRTIDYWKAWLGQCTYTGRWREMVWRSALTLKLLTHDPTGAIVAAPTTSIPEEVGGDRNWDYRFTWIRDAALTLSAFMQLGFTEETIRFMGWLEERAKETGEGSPLKLMYRVDGSSRLDEIVLDHLQGYRDSRPVRIGNGASQQLQLDIYGELLTAIEIFDARVCHISYDLWRHLERMAEWVASNWHRPDEGIWEIRGRKQHFVHSKLQCWVALDRTLRISTRRGFPLDSGRMTAARDEIFRTIMREGYDAERGTFVQCFGASALDASILTMPMVGFISPKDPRMLGTLSSIVEDLSSDSLVYRYEVSTAAGDGLQGNEGTFNICTFWLVEAMALAGQVEQARFLFEKMLTHANHLGLFAEETSETGEGAGNYPQALTHLSLISAACTLDRALGGGTV
ncbi:glycoside hydrolase family 15 protein [Kitasatospora sp. NPDC057738]|uniref:glycoside hydrolase family 15 protein n=1 Tax=Kitasatospora sp. NPDC057738 TaxID=3346233 RepID=UPI00369883A5